MYTRPVVRSNSNVNVWKNSLSRGQLNSILPLVVSIGSLSVIKSPTRVLQKFGTYQSRAIVPFLLTNSLMASSLALCRSTVGFMAGFGVPCICSGLLVSFLLASPSMYCVSVMALV